MRMKKWLFILITISFLLILGSDKGEIVAEAAPSTLTLEYLLPDPGAVLIKSNDDLKTVSNWVVKRPANHTGWSANIYMYDAKNVEYIDGVPVFWHIIGTHSTEDGFPDKRYPVSMFKSQIVSEYGQEVYDLLVDSGKSFEAISGMTYDQYNIYNLDTRFINKNPKDGDMAFMYNENNVWVNLSFTMKEIGCDYNPLTKGCGGIPDGSEPIPPKVPTIPDIGNGGGCPQPYIPSQIEEPFIYKMDLKTDRIEGKTVDTGQNTITPVTVSRVDYSESRNTIKDGLRADIAKHEQMLVECEQANKKLQSELSTLNSNLAKTSSDYNVCLNTSYPIYDKDGEIIGYNSPDCSSYPSAISKIEKQIADKNEEIRLVEVTLDEIRKVIAAIEDYILTIETLEKMYSVIETNVDLNVNGENIQNKSVSLSENEQKVLEYTWVLTKDSTVEGFIDPTDKYPVCDNTINPCEVSNGNNMKETPIYVSTWEAVNSCAKEGTTSTLKGIVRTVQEGYSQSTVKNVYEYATSSLIIDSSEKQRRAGYGFHYKVYTTYLNEDVASDRNTKGADAVSAFKPEILSNYLPYSYEQWKSTHTSSTQVDQNTLSLEGYQVPQMEATNIKTIGNSGSTYTELKEWELPNYSVERYLGNVFEGTPTEARNNPNHDPSDELLDGGRKWYLDWNQPDGAFSYDVLVEGVGVNHLTLCVNGEVDVKGTGIGDENGDSDFVFRFVDPAEPFLSGTGWNWGGLENVLTSLKNWWEEWSYPKSEDVPDNYHEEHYLIEKNSE